ncbi:2-dehydropantoate 2-reductase [Luteolibacter arcticus]|uniref:2-dehydropantoate 2-reductase n=1 Tax=Luteolibacter arcticus TaxID=1581411 RepID=A0ABT3GHT3_9BACT|nr:2-dehydropantoate 2-reductase [Luteolibacter arcticus]MCW1923059.1 2-dehydropantoate 2-reductase [Luteolibacter arcticus]
MSWTFGSVAVVGAGAIGLYYGSRLAAAGEDVRFLLRSDYDTVRRDGIRIESVAGDLHLTDVKAFRSRAEIGPVDLVIVAWKTTSNDLLGEVLPPLLHEGTQVLTLQNGLGNCEQLAAIVGADRVLGALCFVCLNRLSPGHVSHTAGGRISVGEFVNDDRGRAPEIARRFSAAGIPTEAAPDLAAAQWTKLVWNIPFNGLAIAEGGVTTDVLLATPGVEDEIRSLMAEVIGAAQALGLSLEESLIDFNVERTRPMGPYRPSSMIDYVEGREVEFDEIWGEPLRRAKAAGVEVPHLEKLAGRIQERLGRPFEDG